MLPLETVSQVGCPLSLPLSEHAYHVLAVPMTREAGKDRQVWKEEIRLFTLR